MSYFFCFLVIAVLGSAFAFPGQYVPKSFYTIDKNGQKSDVIYLRKGEAPRVRRDVLSGPYGGGGPIGFGGPSSIEQAVQRGLENTFRQVKALAGLQGGGGGYANGLGGGGGGGGYSNGMGGGRSFSNSYGVAGVPGGSADGPVIYSRFADFGGGSEKELVRGGPGFINAMSSAHGPNGGFSFSSSSVDSDGQVQYNTQARRF